MTEQVVVEGVVSAEVDSESRRIVRKGTLGAETLGASSPKVFISWSLRGATGNERFIEDQPKTLTEKFNEAYDEEARQEDEEFFRATKTYYRRRFNTKD
jgi:hypothetical protein